MCMDIGSDRVSSVTLAMRRNLNLFSVFHVADNASAGVKVCKR